MRLRVFSTKWFVKSRNLEYRYCPSWVRACDCLTKERMRADGWITNDDWFIEVDTENNVYGNKHVDMDKIRRLYCNDC